MALGWPVRENGPAPGRQIAPVARCRLTRAFVFQVPCVDWLSPMVQQLIHRRPAAPISRAASRRSSSASPVISATAAGV